MCHDPKKQTKFGIVTQIAANHGQPEAGCGIVLPYATNLLRL